MKYKAINLTGAEPRDLTTETMFELASARAENIELVRFNMALLPEDTGNLVKKNLNAVLKTLKNMKATGQIQFFATQESFKSSSTEAVFLLNKYPDIFENTKDEKDSNTYIYVKI